MSVQNIFAAQLESLQIFDIVLINPPPNSNSAFDPGNTICEKSLVCRLKSDVEFPLNTKLLLRLVATSDQDNVKTVLPTPVETCKVVAQLNPLIEITLTSAAIPLAIGILHLPTMASSCYPHIIAGNAARYHFVLYVKLGCARYYASPGTPLVACVRTGARCDYKCETVEFSDTETSEFNIKVVCGSRIVFAKLPHCVTHCQAPRPILQYYVANANSCKSHIVPCNQCNN